MLNIAFIEPHLNPGIGGIRRIIEVSNRLLARGNAVSIFTPHGKPCTWLPNSVPIAKLFKLSKFSFDVVIFNLAEQYRHALNVSAVRKVFWVLAPEATYKDPIIPLQALQRKEFYFMANSNFTVNYITSRVKVPYEIPIIQGGINQDHFFYNPEIKKEFNLLYYGSSRPWKGTSIIESAIQMLPAGTKCLKMEGKNTPQNQMYSLYNKCDITVTANLSEGFSFIQLESMACGSAVVTTDDGGSRDYVKHNYNALVVQRNPSALAIGIKELMVNKELRKRLIRGGLETANQNKYKWESVTTKLNDTLTKLITTIKK